MYMRGLEHANPFNFNSISETSPTRPYGNSVLLNEIHTMFPAFLYDKEQFQSVNDVFNYVDRQMDERYNVFNTNRLAYRRRNPRTPFPRRNNGFQQAPRVPQAPRGQRNRPQYNQRDEQPLPYLAQVSPNSTPVRVHSDLLANLFAAAALIDPTIIPASFNDPVLVIPTEQQLASGTSITTAVMNLESPCAVCQDTMSTGHSVRRLNRCGHTFHSTCIDTWFQRNVHCPVCRHDIRE